MLNAFITSGDFGSLIEHGVNEIITTVKGDGFVKIPRAINARVFRTVESADDLARLPMPLIFPPMPPDIYLPKLNIEFSDIDAITEFVLSNKPLFMVKCCTSLEEVGHFDAKFRRSPIMLLHSLGLLKNAIIVGGTYLDKDDLSIMVQENAKLVLTPTTDAGSGNGLINYVSYRNSGVKMALGSGENAYNATGSIAYEAEFLHLTVNAEMRSANAFKKDDYEMLTGMTLEEFLK